MSSNRQQYRRLSEQEIRSAQESSFSVTEVCQKLDVVYKTYKKWADLYGIHDEFKKTVGSGRKSGIKNNPEASKYPPSELAKGMHTHMGISRYKDKLIVGGYLKEKCCACGFDERRITDNKVPLIVNFIDGDSKNRKVENVELLCPNCYYLGVGSVSQIIDLDMDMPKGFDV